MINTLHLYSGQIIILMTLGIIALYIVRSHSLRRRRDRKADLARYWRAFNDPAGCWDAVEWFDDGMLIVGSRKISFAEVGCPNETAFREAAEESLKRKIVWIKREHARIEPQIPQEDRQAAVERRDQDFDELARRIQEFSPFFDLESFLKTV